MSEVVGVGIDGIEIARVREALARTPSLIERVWTEAERARCISRSGELRYGGLAARFAAKEAVAKALGSGLNGFGFLDIEVINDAGGKPEVRLHTRAAARAAAIGAQEVHLSLSRTRELALAHAVAVRSVGGSARGLGARDAG